jgi:hypothetical protein
MGASRIATLADSSVETRRRLAAQFIPAGARVLEIDGASLATHLPFGCVYRSAKRDAVSADALAKYDIVVMLGALQTQTEVDRFLRQFASAERPLLISYSNEGRLRFHDLIRLIGRNGLRVETSASVGDDEMLLRLVPARKIAAIAPCSVAVLSGNMSFAERLGWQMLSALLPGESNLHFVDLGELETARDRYDLVVLGVGQGLCHSLCSSAVLDVVARARSAIGIFGTMQRELLPRAAFDRLLDRLDVWFARSQDDVMLYGRGRSNVTYLGDWLMTQFPLGHGRDPELLTVSEDSLRDLPLDRTIAAMARHQAVFARTPAALLCALNSADTVAYADDLHVPSGEFASLLYDVFGRTFAANEFFQVDRDAVLRYRARIQRNVVLMRTRIDALLRGKAASAA